MTEYRSEEDTQDMLDDIEAQGFAAFRETFMKRLWIPIAGSALLVYAAIAYLLIDAAPLNKTLDVLLSLFLVVMIWGQRYMRSQLAASEAKYAQAMSYLDNLEDNEDEDEPDA